MHSQVASDLLFRRTLSRNHVQRKTSGSAEDYQNDRLPSCHGKLPSHILLSNPETKNSECKAQHRRDGQNLMIAPKIVHLARSDHVNMVVASCKDISSELHGMMGLRSFMECESDMVCDQQPELTPHASKLAFRT
jgi:hypothetical protein